LGFCQNGNNFIGGGFLNQISGEQHAGTIVSGNQNCITGSVGANLDDMPCLNAILGGQSNRIQVSERTNHNTIGGGVSNSICSFGSAGNDFQSAGNSTIGGGSTNLIKTCVTNGSYTKGASGHNTIAGGRINNICCNSHSTIGGGILNIMKCCGGDNVIAGGRNNIICCDRGSAILGGCINYICTVGTSCQNAIIGGLLNVIGCGDGGVCQNTIGGGRGNRICCNGVGNFVAGCNNCLGAGSSTNNSRFSAVFGCNNKTCADHNFMAGYNNTIGSSFDRTAILGTYGKTATANDQLMVCCICAFGALSKASGTFTIDHPNPCKTATHHLKHSFVESPTAGDNVYRWEVDIDDTLQGEVILPEYYRYLNENSQVWINPVDNLGRAFGIVNISATKVKITTSDPGKFNVLVIGTRKDKAAVEAWKGVEILKTEEEKLNYKG
jgi:hypothetical protein